MSDIQLEDGLNRRNLSDIGMGIGVAADHMALVQLALHQTRPGLHILTDDEEGGGGLLFLQNIENVWGPARVRSIVKGQGYKPRIGPIALNLIGRWHHIIMLVGNQAVVGVNRDGTFACRWVRRDMQHLTCAIKINTLPRPHLSQTR